MPASDLHNETLSRASLVFGELGRPEATPIFAPGEPIQDYRKRICNKLAAFSDTWRGTDTTPFTGKALDQAERQIYADAIAYANSPASVPPGELREIIDPPDRTGRRVGRFIGDPEACWAPFKQLTRSVLGIRER